MTKPDKITEKQWQLLLKYPAYISLLAANKNSTLDEQERAEAIKICHIKTFSCNAVLSGFYAEADSCFEKNISELDQELPRDSAERTKAIAAKLEEAESVLAKLGPEFAHQMHESMKAFKDHVSKAHNNVLEYFLFPMPIKGIF